MTLDEQIEAARAHLEALEAKKAAAAEVDWICSGIPDEAVEAGIAAWDKANNDLANYVSGVTPDWDEGMIVCAIYKAMAPLAPTPAPMSEEEVEALAGECVHKARLSAGLNEHAFNLGVARDAARLAIRETLKRARGAVRWPGEEGRLIDLLESAVADITSALLLAGKPEKVGKWVGKYIDAINEYDARILPEQGQ